MGTLTELEFHELPNPTNIYGSCTFIHRGKAKLLLSARNQVFCIHTNDIENSIQWNFAPIVLANISAESDIISLDCTSPDTKEISPVLAVAFTHHHSLTQDTTKKAFLNIYTSHLPDEAELLDDVSVLFSSVDDCQVIALSYIPFKIIHQVQSKGLSFLVSGSDNKMHIYLKDSRTNQYSEASIAEFFPQLSKLPSSAISCDIQTIKSRRLVAVGCQDGYLDFSIDSQADSKNVVLDGPISSVVIYLSKHNYIDNLHGKHPSIASLEDKIQRVAPLPIFSGEENVSIVVSDSIGYVVLYRDVLRKSLADPIVLPSSDAFDTVTCILVADIDFDGINELIVGTYGQVLLIYKLKPSSDMEFYLAHKMGFPQPIMGLDWVDLTHDGCNTLVVVTHMGVHILQPDIGTAREEVLKTMHTMQELRMLEENLLQQLKRQDALKVQEVEYRAITSGSHSALVTSTPASLSTSPTYTPKVGSPPE